MIFVRRGLIGSDFVVLIVRHLFASFYVNVALILIQRLTAILKRRQQMAYI